MFGRFYHSEINIKIELLKFIYTFRLSLTNDGNKDFSICQIFHYKLIRLDFTLCLAPLQWSFNSVWVLFSFFFLFLNALIPITDWSIILVFPFWDRNNKRHITLTVLNPVCTFVTICSTRSSEWRKKNTHTK